jgi:hypothetical protein
VNGNLPDLRLTGSPLELRPAGVLTNRAHRIHTVITCRAAACQNCALLVLVSYL